MPLLKAIARSLAGHPSLARLLWQRRRDRQLVVMMHRFADPGAGYVGHEPQALRTLLSYLRKSGVILESVDDLTRRTLEADAPATRGTPPAVAFTVDDGYADVATLAQPVFAEFDCPFTVYVVPEVVDGRRSFWWDQLAFMMQHSRTRQWVIPVGTEQTVVAWNDDATAFTVRKQLEERVRRLAPAEIDVVLRECSRQADVPAFTETPSQYRVLTWDEMRSLEQRGVQFGAHGMTHTALSACTDEQARWEIHGSLARIREELRHPSSVFCYPYGKQEDYLVRDEQVVASTGCLGAISSEHGSSRPPARRETLGTWRWRMPRMPYDPRPGTTLRAFFD